ncbi:uncharacterized protein LOC117654417 [Thrips palmi]|uniref:Uncharacterized protein LOC117654417 n=1 Tax=Thrips palmi TaxID=161013 RepID=A0A6P9AHS2_THRPL|nr:uncharacterized protein LOC117654417 [Thrips palmi]
MLRFSCLLWCGPCYVSSSISQGVTPEKGLLTYIDQCAEFLIRQSLRLHLLAWCLIQAVLCQTDFTTEGTATELYTAFGTAVDGAVTEDANNALFTSNSNQCNVRFLDFKLTLTFKISKCNAMFRGEIVKHLRQTL